MLADHISVSSSQWSEERSMVIHLILTTLSGEEAQLTIELQEFDRLQEFESAVLEQLPEIGNSSTFGCELDFLCCNSQQKLVDPIWHTLRDCNSFTVSFVPQTLAFASTVSALGSNSPETGPLSHHMRPRQNKRLRCTLFPLHVHPVTSSARVPELGVFTLFFTLVAEPSKYGSGRPR